MGARGVLRLTPICVVAAAGALLSGCGGSSVNVQGAPTTAGTNRTSGGAPTATPVTTGFGDAQPAADVLLKVLTAYDAAIMSPTTSSASSFDTNMAGSAKQSFDASFAELGSSVAWRGTPDAARLTVVSMTDKAGLPEVDLVNCPLRSTKDPFRAYDTATGKDLPSPAADKVPRPWPQIAKLFQPNGVGHWILTSFDTDMTKTCGR